MALKIEKVIITDKTDPKWKEYWKAGDCCGCQGIIAKRRAPERDSVRLVMNAAS